MSNRWAVLALIMAAQTMANVGPLGIPSIAPLTWAATRYLAATTSAMCTTSRR